MPSPRLTATWSGRPGSLRAAAACSCRPSSRTLSQAAIRLHSAIRQHSAISQQYCGIGQHKAIRQHKAIGQHKAVGQHEAIGQHRAAATAARGTRTGTRGSCHRVRCRRVRCRRARRSRAVTPGRCRRALRSLTVNFARYQRLPPVRSGLRTVSSRGMRASRRMCGSLRAAGGSLGTASLPAVRSSRLTGRPGRRSGRRRAVLCGRTTSVRAPTSRHPATARLSRLTPISSKGMRTSTWPAGYSRRTRAGPTTAPTRNLAATIRQTAMAGRGCAPTTGGRGMPTSAVARAIRRPLLPAIPANAAAMPSARARMTACRLAPTGRAAVTHGRVTASRTASGRPR